MSTSTPGDAALSVPVSPPSEPVPVPVPEQGQGQEQLQQVDLPTVPASAPALPAGPEVPDKAEAEGETKAGAVTAPATPVPSIEKYVAPDQNDKRPKGSVSVSASAIPKRPNGPSLLTQQLAEARRILSAVSGQSTDAPHPSPRLQHHPYDPAIGSHPKLDHSQDKDSGTTITPQNKNDPEGNYDSDGGSLTPRASPRAIAMASSIAVSMISLPPRATDAHNLLSHTLDVSDFGNVGAGFGSHRELLRSSGRGTSLERTDKEKRVQELSSASRTYSDTSAPPIAAVMTSDRDFARSDARLDPDPTSDQRSPTRPRKLDHRLSMGPEKAWSIGADDLTNGQDGQVEKSIAEVLAGVEPNARSRKASHSLRFFKEGLPEEKPKRRDSRLGPSPREKLSPTASEGTSARARGVVRGDDHVKSLQTSPGPTEEVPGRLTRTKTFPLRSTGALKDDEGPRDYFHARREHKGHADPESPLDKREPLVPKPKPKPTAASGLSKEYQEAQDGSSDTADTGGIVEDGELSGEEKISSAVFLPHKGPHDAQEDPDDLQTGFDIPATPGKPHQKTDDGSSWLVKADEPEADEPESPGAQVDDKTRDASHPRLEARHHTIGSEVLVYPGPMPPASVDHDFAQQTLPRSSEFPPQDHEDYIVHDHQLGPNQTLDAIELVPYSHQVGGHTTLWKFSKRAVCKQLNNRENEFYEKIERYHKDLLAFLPRYIGVLNVTYSKQSRRKSAVRRDENAALERKKVEQMEPDADVQTNGSSLQDETAHKPGETTSQQTSPRVISQSLQSSQTPIPTVTFVDNRHILPRSLLQPAAKAAFYPDRGRSSSISVPASHYASNGLAYADTSERPSLEDRHANSWGTTLVNKRLRHEVFNDVFLKQPINVQRHKKAHQRTIPRKILDRLLRPASSDSSMMRRDDAESQSSLATEPSSSRSTPTHIHQKTQSDVGPLGQACAASDEEPNDVTGTSAPEPDILSETMSPQKKKRRHSGSALRRKPKDVSDPRGNLQYWEEPDEAGYKGDNEDFGAQKPKVDGPKIMPSQSLNGSAEVKDVVTPTASSTYPSTATTSLATSPMSEFKKIPRPVNPKEAQTQHDSRVSYFLLLEDLTAGMKRPCIMDLKMGTRQYGVDANPKKQKSQQRKCAQTTSRELGVRVCGLQVWDAKSQTYVFKDKYYGRDLKAGQEFQDALTMFLYDGVDRHSILRHIPTILQKLSKLEVIVRRLRGYRFYAASLLVTYDGDQSQQDNYDTAIEDSTTDFATDTEDAQQVRRRKNKREIDFKIADFANSLVAGDLAKDKPCPPQHPDEPDRGFLKGLRSLRKFFLRIQHDTRAELGLPSAQRNLVYDPQMDVSDSEESTSE